MFASGDGHVWMLAASIRNTQHLLYSFQIGAELVTVPSKLLEQWIDQGRPLPDSTFSYHSVGAKIPYEDLDLDLPWTSLKIEHELTTKGIQKFVADYRSTLRAAS